MTSIRVLLTSTITDKDGKIVKQTTIEPKSLVQALMYGLDIKFKAGTLTTTTKDISGTSYFLQNNATMLLVDAIATDDTNGIVIGTGTNAVTMNDFKLQTQIAHGGGAGQMLYTVMSIQEPTTTASQASITLSRQFQNSSGGTIVVTEVGIYSTCHESGGTNPRFCIERTLKSDTVLNTQTLTETYTIYIST